MGDSTGSISYNESTLKKKMQDYLRDDYADQIKKKNPDLAHRASFWSTVGYLVGTGSYSAAGVGIAPLIDHTSPWFTGVACLAIVVFGAGVSYACNVGHRIINKLTNEAMDHDHASGALSQKYAVALKAKEQSLQAKLDGAMKQLPVWDRLQDIQEDLSILQHLGVKEAFADAQQDKAAEAVSVAPSTTSAPAAKA